MPSEKDKSVLKPYDYEIDGNSIRAFYDKDKKLVFVLDLTTDKYKPNVLLVMTSYGDRKWDDVLSNDYGMDLELVRPKKDNKYQKLDIQYDGLVVYDNLIRVYQDGGDVKPALQDLADFRAMSVRRSAKERLETSTVIAEKTRETIERTGDAIVDLRAKIKAVRSKLTTLRRNVGKEPTKQSASKILKAEAQLDVLQGKLERAQKRLENANKRLLIAEDDIAAARKVLDLVPDVGDDAKFKTVETPALVPAPVVRDDTKEESDEDSEPDDEEYDDFWLSDNEEESEEDNNEYNSEEVKPLFDKDPNILDENIAFKPINFDEKPMQSSHEDGIKDVKTDVEPMSFTPPKPIMDVVQVPGSDESGDIKLDDVFADSIDDEVTYNFEPPREEEKVVAEESETISESDEATVPMLDSLQSVNSEDDTASVLEQDEHVTEIVAPDVQENPLANTEITDAAPMANTGVAPAPTVSEQNVGNIVRPVSAVRPPYTVTDIPKPDNHQHKPNLLYYVLLLVLIALSIFTLWLYQRSNVTADAVPELLSDDTPALVQSETQKAVEQKTDKSVTDNIVIGDDNPFITADDGNTKANTVSVEDVNQNSSENASETVDEEVQPADKDFDDTDTFIDDALEQPDETEELSEEDAVSELPVVNKPEYKVTQENVFTDDTSGVIGGNLCDGDVSPDANGCCPGETYSTVDGQQVCCPDDGGDCFSPMF